MVRTRSVFANLWSVEDQSSTRLVPSVDSHIAKGEDKALAIRFVGEQHYSSHFSILCRGPISEIVDIALLRNYK